MEQRADQREEEEKPAIAPESLPHPASRNCSFCRTSGHAKMFGAEYPVRDPKTFAIITEVLICSDCVLRLAASLSESSDPAP